MDRDEAAINVRLERHGIVANTTSLPRRAGDVRGLGLRLGSTPMTIRGLASEGYGEVAAAVARRVSDGAEARPEIEQRMRALARAHPAP